MIPSDTMKGRIDDVTYMELLHEVQSRFRIMNLADYLETPIRDGFRLKPMTGKKGVVAGFVCPFCGSGTGQNGHNTGAFALYTGSGADKDHFYCHRCKAHGDVLDLYQKLTGCSQRDAMLDLARAAGIDTETDYRPPRLNVSAEAWKKQNYLKNALQTAPERSMTAEMEQDEYQRARDLLARPEAVEYLLKRGITLGTAYNCGFMGFSTENGGRMLAFMFNGRGGYAIRSICSGFKGNRPGSGSDIVNKPILWNKPGYPVWICEGMFDSLSIIEAGYRYTCCLNSTSLTGRLLDAVKAKPPTGALILALDKDAAGGDAMRKLAAELERLGVKYVIPELDGSGKDPNDLWLEDPEKFRNLIMNISRGAFYE